MQIALFFYVTLGKSFLWLSTSISAVNWACHVCFKVSLTICVFMAVSCPENLCKFGNFTAVSAGVREKCENFDQKLGNFTEL